MKLESKHGWVEVVDTRHLALVEQPLGGPYFVVTGSSGYRAQLRACPCERTPCDIKLTVDHNTRHAIKVNGKSSSSVDAWSKHSKDHCHGWHRAKAEAFAREVLATYGTKPPRRRDIGTERGTARDHAALTEFTRSYLEKLRERDATAPSDAA